jgi:type VI secretion system protein ImpL
MDYTDFPLILRLPVSAQSRTEEQTLMFLRLSLMTQGSKLPLSIQPLPTRAPRSPFLSNGSPASLAINEGAL